MTFKVFLSILFVGVLWSLSNAERLCPSAAFEKQFLCSGVVSNENIQKCANESDRLESGDFLKFFWSGNEFHTTQVRGRVECVAKNLPTTCCTQRALNDPWFCLQRSEEDVRFFSSDTVLSQYGSCSVGESLKQINLESVFRIVNDINEIRVDKKHESWQQVLPYIDIETFDKMTIYKDSSVIIPIQSDEVVLLYGTDQHVNTDYWEYGHSNGAINGVLVFDKNGRPVMSVINDAWTLSKRTTSVYKNQNWFHYDESEKSFDNSTLSLDQNAPVFQFGNISSSQ